MRFMYTWVRLCLAAFLGMICISAPVQTLTGEGFTAGKALFQVQCNNQTLNYKVQGLFVLPGERIDLEIAEADTSKRYALHTESMRVKRLSGRKWFWRAPERSGFYPVELCESPTKARVIINIFVMLPFQNLRQGYVRKYRIGAYPLKGRCRSAAFRPPRGFIEVTPVNRDIYVSPHFQLKQFICKQSEEYPHYIVLDPRLLVKMEILLQQLNTRGYACRTLHVMSGYRTPYYNRRIGNVSFSSHVWGRAADVFVDEDHDGYMDDLNKDGKRDFYDTGILYNILEQIEDGAGDKSLLGGLGLYAKTSTHGPFVHVDVRGQRARWGIAFSKPTLARKKH